MKLAIKGSIHERSRFAKVDTAHEDLAALVGKKITTAVPDTFLLVQELGEDSITFNFLQFQTPNIVTLKKGESWNVKREGNAYGYELTFALE